MTEKGVLTVLSGFSGTGKGTVVKELLRRYEQYALSVSATTREPREGEVHGREYYFLTTEEFEKMIGDGAFYEYARYVDHYYGTPRVFVEEQLQKGKDVILEIEIKGALEIKRQNPGCLLIFLIPPSAEELKARLAGRGTESEEVIMARLRRAVDEAEGVEAYDYILENNDLEECVNRLHGLIGSAHNRAEAKLDQVKSIREELKAMVKGE